MFTKKNASPIPFIVVVAGMLFLTVAGVQGMTAQAKADAASRAADAVMANYHEPYRAPSPIVADPDLPIEGMSVRELTETCEHAHAKAVQDTFNNREDYNGDAQISNETCETAIQLIRDKQDER